MPASKKTRALLGYLVAGHLVEVLCGRRAGASVVAGILTGGHTRDRQSRLSWATAHMAIDGQEVVLPAGSITRFPNNVMHDVRNLGVERCVIMFIKINPKLLKESR